MLEVAKWWSGSWTAPKRRFIYLRRVELWQVIAVETVKDQDADRRWQRDFAIEQAARECIREMIERSGGQWAGGDYSRPQD